MKTKCCESYNGMKDITNSCIFCKTYISRNTDKRLEEFESKLYKWRDLDEPVRIQAEIDFLKESISQAIAEEREKIKTLASIIKDIKGYSPDGEVGTLCDQALQITNLDKEE